MGQTLGGQLLGVWYEVGTFWGAAMVFLYLSLSAETRPWMEERLPPWLLKRSTVTMLVLFLFAVGASRAFVFLSAPALPEVAEGHGLEAPLDLQLVSVNAERLVSVDDSSIVRDGDSAEFIYRIAWTRPVELALVGKASFMSAKLRVDCRRNSRTLLDLRITAGNRRVYRPDRASETEVLLSTAHDAPERAAVDYVCDGTVGPGMPKIR